MGGMGIGFANKNLEWKKSCKRTSKSIVQLIAGIPFFAGYIKLKPSGAHLEKVYSSRNSLRAPH
jgi:hypothetical protein